ncbi:MAG TPA: hypothetical protein VG893_14040 [Terracidiphilus sp.]|nr:hypothetical protein [Terracidiphilus sp.]
MMHPIRWRHVLRASPWIAVAVFVSASAAQSDSSALPEAPRAHVVSPAAPAEHTVLEDTLIRVITDEAITTRHAETGEPLSFTVSDDVVVDGAVAIPRGALVHGVVVRSKKSGRLTGSPELTLKLVSLDLGGRTYPLYTYLFKMTGMSKTRPTETKTVRGAAIGAVVGAAAVSEKNGEVTASSRTASMAAGAVVGAGVGAVVSAVSPGPGIVVPAEAQVDFYLASPITVAQVSAGEAARLAQGLHHGGPALYVRGETP